MSIFLRAYAPDDVAAFHAATTESKRELIPWMPWCHDNFSLAETEAWIARQSSPPPRNEFEFLIVDDSGRLLGACGINQVDRTNLRANIGYWVRSSAAGRGVATAALRQIVDWARDNTDLRRLEILIAVGNMASIRVAEKAGAVREGILRSRLLLLGRFHDAALFSIILER